MIFVGANKLIILEAGEASISIRDLWSRWIDWLAISDNSKFQPAFESVGANDIDPFEGTKIPVYLFLLNGWRIRPQEANHTLNVTDGVLIVDGGGDPFVNTLGNYVVRINYKQPVQAISFDTSGGGTIQFPPGYQQDFNKLRTQMEELYKIQGLDINAPMTITPNSRVAGDVELEITGDKETFTQIQRQ